MPQGHDFDKTMPVYFQTHGNYLYFYQQRVSGTLSLLLPPLYPTTQYNKSNGNILVICACASQMTVSSCVMKSLNCSFSNWCLMFFTSFSYISDCLSFFFFWLYDLLLLACYMLEIANPWSTDISPDRTDLILKHNLILNAISVIKQKYLMLISTNLSTSFFWIMNFFLKIFCTFESIFCYILPRIYFDIYWLEFTFVFLSEANFIFNIY